MTYKIRIKGIEWRVDVENKKMMNSDGLVKTLDSEALEHFRQSVYNLHGRPLIRY